MYSQSHLNSSRLIDLLVGVVGLQNHIEDFFMTGGRSRTFQTIDCLPGKWGVLLQCYSPSHRPHAYWP